VPPSAESSASADPPADPPGFSASPQWTESDAADPYGTGEIRQAVLETWRRSPARFREDANAEEALATVGYAGRALVEVIANGVDAAVAAGEPARIRITLDHDELTVANTGAPFTAAGMAALASLRASAKRDQAGDVGRFGVGFTAVLSITDRPLVVSADGAVRFDSIRTEEAVRDLESAELTEELHRRAGVLPVLRLPWPVAGAAPPPHGFATEVRLPLRAGISGSDLLAQVGDHLLLALPALESLELPDRVLRRLPIDSAAGEGPGSPGRRSVTVVTVDGNERTEWRTVSRTGRWSPDELRSLPVEQRSRADWSVLWAFPVNRFLDPEVLYAPTPTDELLSLPARLIGSFVVDDTRRHLASSALNDRLLDEAVAGYIELLLHTPDRERLTLLPPRELGRSAWDNQLSLRIWERAAGTPLLVTAAGDPIRAEDALVLANAQDELVLLAAQAVPQLLPPPRSSRERNALRALGARVLPLSQLSSALSALDRPPSFWNEIYRLLDPGSAEELADLPVPLVSGRTVLGPRGCLVPIGDDTPTGLALLAPGVRLIAPDAVAAEASRALLLRIGAVPADATAVLAEPSVQSAIEDLRSRWEDDEVAILEVRSWGSAVLDAIAAGGQLRSDVVGSLLLTGDDGEAWPATELLAPGSALAELLAPDSGLSYLGAEWVERYDADVLRRAGVLDSFRVVVDAEPRGPDHDLPDEDEYWEDVFGARAAPSNFVALADLDLVAEDRWLGALSLIGGHRDTRSALLSSTDGEISYSAWWIRRFGRIAGQRPGFWRRPDAHELAGLYDPLLDLLDAEICAAVGVLASLEQALTEDAEDVLFRFADDERRIPLVVIPTLTGLLAQVLRNHPPSRLPEGMRTLAGTVADAESVLVLDVPWLSQVVPASQLAAGGTNAAVIASAFDLELASVRLSFPLVTGAAGQHPAPTGPELLRAVDGRVLDLRNVADQLAAGSFLEVLASVAVHPELAVLGNGAGARGSKAERHRVSWWCEDGTFYVDGSAAGWGRLTAHLLGKWPLRHTATAVFAGRSSDLVEDGG
jgi:hypothetical protein